MVARPTGGSAGAHEDARMDGTSPPTTRPPAAPVRSRRQQLVDAGAIIALLGLIFSGITWLQANVDADTQQRIADRDRIAELALELAELPIRDLQLTADLDGAAAAAASSALNVKQVTLIELLDERLPEDDEVAVSARYALGEALLRVGDYGRAIEQFDAVMTGGDSYVTELAAHRQVASALVQLGRHEEAVAQWERALSVHDRYDVPAAVVRASAVQTYSAWGTAELSRGDCLRAAELLDEARASIATTADMSVHQIVAVYPDALEHQISQFC